MKRLTKNIRGKSKDKNMSSRRRGSVGEHRRPLMGAYIFLLRATPDLEAVATENIRALGGQKVHTIDDATHTMLLLEEKKHAALLDDAVMSCVAKSQKLRVPIVGPSWLRTVAGLAKHGGADWTQVDVGTHFPSLLQYHHGTTAARNHYNRRGRRDSSKNLGASLNESFSFMTKDSPADLEEAALRRAIELSMLDLALVFRPHHHASFASATQKQNDKSTLSLASLPPHEVLEVPEQASTAQIKAAYKKRARETHPDKGGAPGDFEAVARAYRHLLRGGHEPPPTKPKAIKNTAHWDLELRDHQTLVSELFQNHESDLAGTVAKMEQTMDRLGLAAKEAGASNINEKNERIANSCFYLSLAASYLHGMGALTSTTTAKATTKTTTQEEQTGDSRSADEALIGETALDLKRTIEAAVVNAHPEWAEQGKVGEEVQAFSDFLVYILDSATILSDWAVAVFDSASGFVDVYKGKNYTENEQGWARTNTITLKYVPGHYQPLLPREDATRPDLGSLLKSLDSEGLFYVVTDGAAP